MKRWLKYGGVVLAFLAMITGSLLFYLQNQQAGPFTKSDTTRTQIPLYNIRNLPEGYAFKQSSVSLSADVASYVLTNGQANIFVAEQARADSIDYDEFHSKQIKNSYRVPTGIGEAVIGNLNGKPTLSLVGRKTWILMRSSHNIDFAVLEDVSRNLVPVD